jgi:hypothetical protein
MIIFTGCLLLEENVFGPYGTTKKWATRQTWDSHNAAQGSRSAQWEQFHDIGR